MAKLIHDASGQRKTENGISLGVLFNIDTSGAYLAGKAWNGLTSIEESPTGGEATDFYADNILYGSILSAEKFEGTINAFMYPDGFRPCLGEKEVTPGMFVSGQPREKFGLAYRTEIGNDLQSEAGFQIHLLYGVTAAPSSVTRETVNDSPTIAEFGWPIKAQPVPVTGLKPSAHVVFDSTLLSEAGMQAIVDAIYGTDSTEPLALKTPDEYKQLIITAAAG